VYTQAHSFQRIVILTQTPAILANKDGHNWIHTVQ